MIFTEKQLESIIQNMEDEQERQTGSRSLENQSSARVFLLNELAGGFSYIRSRLGQDYWIDLHMKVHNTLNSRRAFFDYLENHVKKQNLPEEFIVNGETIML